MTSNNQAIVAAVKVAISPARIATYETAVGMPPPESMAALDLYAWNASISGAMLIPLHVCEVTIRNAVATAIESVYGAEWPWSVGFERSLPDPKQSFSPKRDLLSARNKYTATKATGKVIAELKFAFWQSIFTNRHDKRFWEPSLLAIFPNMDSAKTIEQRRKMIYDDLEQLRRLRNRIAHHEPIFSRVLADDYSKIVELVRFRCAMTAAWLEQNQTVVKTLATKP
jgi:hypothetical protein